MAQEYLIADFSGGINPSVQPDKLQLNESLQLQNARIDETGGLGNCPGSSLQGGPYTDTASNLNVHSLFVAPSLGILAGVGQDAFTGLTLGGLVDSLSGLNTAKSKMSAATTPNRIYFEIGGVPYVVGGSINVPLTVDWAPPSAVVPIPTSPTSPTTASTLTYLSTSPHWSTIAGLIGSTATASTQFTPTSAAYSDYARAINPNPSLGTAAIQGVQITAVLKASSNATVGANRVRAILEVGGSPVGSPRDVFVNMNQAAGTYTFGGAADLFGNLAITVAQANASNFGVRFLVLNGGSKSANVSQQISNVKFQFYQSSAASGLTVGTGGAGVLSGTYTYAATFVSDQGEESDVSALSNAVTLATQQGSLTNIPVGDARTVSRNIYRIGNTLTSLYLVGSLPDNVSTSFADNLSDNAALTTGVIVPGGVAGSPANTRFGSQIAHYPCLHYDRVFWAVGNTIVWSKPLNGFAYPVNNFATVGNSTPITGLVSKWGCLIIIKTDEIRILSGTDENTFSLTRTESIVGTSWPFTIAPISNGVLFANSQGPFIFNGAVSTKLTPKLDLLFRNENRNAANAIEVVNTAVTQNFCAVANTDFFYLAVASAGSPSNNLLFVISMTTGTITTRSMPVLSLAVDNTTGYIYAGLANGDIIQLDDYTSLPDSQGPLNWTYQSKYTDAGNRGSNLVVWALEFWGNTNGAVVTPTISYDGGLTSEKLPSFSTTSNQRVERKFNAAKSRLCQTVSIQLDSPISNNHGPIDMIHCKLFYDVHTGRARTGNVS